ncbi:DNA-binding transcriptional regulator, AcrR family [Prauserella marina]|uniref:DNA-binding transcriptional regulator, AcrR family n=2 Tax=Prauserella marina TaxID=530584 RepID=A0A1G6TM97_9PSEU|nr:TetR family transcriptional regulator [Prauserella marina]SDD30149.1 DNA-binding transcriptional regulator, AcrR family [Prauserella marina]
MSDIAEVTGITSRALYRHYANKQALLSHVLFEAQGAFLAALPEYPADADPGALPATLHDMASASLAERDMARLWRREARHIEAEGLRVLRGRLNDLVSRLANVIRARHPALAEVEVFVRAWAVIAIVNSHEESAGLFDQEQTARLLGAAALAAVDAEQAEQAEGTAGDPPESGRRWGSVSRREQLLAIAAGTFRRSGFDGASVDGIAMEAGIAGPAIYRYFESKTDMLVAIADRFREWVSLETIRALRAATSDTDALGGLIGGYVKIAAEAEDLLSVTVTEAHHLPSDAAERLARARTERSQEWAHWARAIRQDRSEAATQLLVNTAQVVVDDLVRTPRVVHAEGAAEALTSVATAVLRDTDTRPPR